MRNRYSGTRSIEHRLKEWKPLFDQILKIPEMVIKFLPLSTRKKYILQS